MRARLVNDSRIDFIVSGIGFSLKEPFTFQKTQLFAVTRLYFAVNDISIALLFVLLPPKLYQAEALG